MIEYVAGQCTYLSIGLGSCNKRGTGENPFSAEEREAMIKASLDIAVPYDIKRIPDFGDYDKWIAWIGENIGFDVFYTNSQRENKIFTKAGFEVKPIPFFNRTTYCATNIREAIISGDSLNELLPDGTLSVLEDIDGFERLKEVTDYCE